MTVQQFYSVDQVAGLLDLHVKTVRAYVRGGRLKATRIGKQYRIAREDLEAFTGAPLTPTVPAAPAEARRARHVEASTIVQIDAIGPAEVSRLSNALMASVSGRHGGRSGGAFEDRVRVETVHDEERASLKIVVLGDLAVTADLLKIVQALTSETHDA
ncbi:helix-turn-helix domain-containing protein [Streptomyces sp. NPDC091272]|uniref:helix-turn-helix domain-containing protein n=1 Tax=Streptomyces sp. NPDC091272 TaxID=3365981 RepID=UPI00381B6B6D